MYEESRCGFNRERERENIPTLIQQKGGKLKRESFYKDSERSKVKVIKCIPVSRETENAKIAREHNSEQGAHMEAVCKVEKGVKNSRNENVVCSSMFWRSLIIVSDNQLVIIFHISINLPTYKMCFSQLRIDGCYATVILSHNLYFCVGYYLNSFNQQRLS